MKCRVCLQHKPDEDFGCKNKAKLLRHTLCRGCMREYNARHYRENAAVYKQRGMVNGARRREDLHRRLLEYLSSHPCVDCGEADPIVLELDHRNAADKLHNLSRMWYNGYAWNKIEQEIAKCDVRCANCHRRRTAHQQGWSNLTIYMPP